MSFFEPLLPYAAVLGILVTLVAGVLVAPQIPALVGGVCALRFMMKPVPCPARRRGPYVRK